MSRKSPFITLPVDLEDNKAANDGQYVDSRSPSWVVAFVRFDEPVCWSVPVTKAMDTKKMLVVVNDIVAIDISNSKSSPYKTLSAQIKMTDVYYPGEISSGDWVVAWMADNQEHCDYIANFLNGSRGTASDPKLYDWNSGLKFIGRVLGVDHTQTINSGLKTFDISINAQSFVEMATSVYFSDIAQQIFGLTPGDIANADRTYVAANILKKGLEFNQDMGGKLYKILNADGPFKYFTCDELVAINLVLAMGMVNNGQDFITQTGISIPANFGDAIQIPKQLANILGRPSTNRLWKLYNVFLGLQKYGAGKSATPWETFSPLIKGEIVSGNSPSIYQTRSRCKGWAAFLPPEWSNKALWAILNEFLNPISNEMYTALRCGPDNKMALTLVMREIPFSSQFIDQIPISDTMKPTYSKSVETSTEGKKKTTATVYKTKGRDIVEANLDKTYYNNVPRWVIDGSIVKQVSLRTSEDARLNFVQVWGTSTLTSMALGIVPQSATEAQVAAPDTTSGSGENAIKAAQLLAKNWVIDQTSIRRHGLRASVEWSPFDYPVFDPVGAFTYAKHWAKMRADWYFNGEQKLTGTIVCRGIQEPICEGDNLEYDGMLYHIISVRHSASISVVGTKTFTTSIGVINGMPAAYLDDASKKRMPVYAINIEDSIASVEDKVPARSYNYKGPANEEEG